MEKITSIARQIKDFVLLLSLLTLAPIIAPATVSANPALTPGVWTDITPAAAQVGYANAMNLFTQGITIDPENPNVLYFATTGYNPTTFDEVPGNIWKTTDGGSDWSALSPLDAPIHIRIDPNNSNHLYAVDGVRGNYAGFWVSEDGGNTWTEPAGFTTLCSNLNTEGYANFNDGYTIALDPTNANHVLYSSHSCSGVVGESTDGGNTWVSHVTPATTCTGGYFITFLYDPPLGIGNSGTWLFCTQTGGVFRTSNSGTTWTLISTANSMNHGGNQTLYTSTGVLLSGGDAWPVAPQAAAPMRSTDNGMTWEGPTTVPAGFNDGAMGMVDSGTTIYTGPCWGGVPMFTSPDSDGLNWTVSSGCPTLNGSGPFEMAYDSVNGIVYATITTNGPSGQGTSDGVWAYKVPNGSGPPAAPTGLAAVPGNAQVALTWSTTSAATSYNVLRSTVNGSGYASVATGISSTNYTNTGLTNGATYYYVVDAVDAFGTSPNSVQVSATPTAPVGGLVSINCAGPAVSPFIADVDFTGGATATNWTGAIVTSGLTNPAPQAVYQSERYGPSTYTIPGLTSGTSYTVRLHLCENYLTASGQREFNVAINGITELTNFDIFATAGGEHIGVIEQFTVAANGSGQEVIAFTNGAQNSALVDGIEVVATGGSVPSAPTGLTSTAGNAQVSLSWTASSGATSYNVLRSTVNGSGYASVATGIATTAYTNTGLTNGTTYYFVVTATNASGTSGNSNQASATPAASGSLANPSFETPALSAGAYQYNPTGGSWTFASNSGIANNGSGFGNPTAPNGVQVAFLQGNGGTNGTISQSMTFTAGNYTISFESCQRSPDSQSIKVYLDSTLITTITPTSTSFAVYTTPSFAETAGTHVIQFTGGSTSGDNTAFIDSVAINPAGGSAPTAPTGLAATGGNAQAALSWSASSGATSYNVFRGTSAGGESATAIVTGLATTSYTNTGLTNGTKYYFTVKALNAVGTSPASSEASATPQLSAPAAPTGLTATGGSAQVALAWTASTGATNYNVLRSTVSGSAYASVSSGITTTAYTNTGLTNGTTYYFVVTAVNAGGTSGNSNQASATPSAGGNSVTNPSFETPVESGYVYNPTGGTWTFGSSSGICSNGSGFGNPNAPNGTQVAFLQTVQGNGWNGTITQSTTFTAGSHTLSFQACQRNGNSQTIQILIDGTQVATVTPTSTSFAAYTTTSFTTTAGAHTLQLAGDTANGDQTAFVDVITIN